MSYILDALKKLEQKRGNEESPRVLIFGRHVTQERRKRRTWSYALLAALLLNAGIMVWLIGPWRTVEQKAEPGPTTVSEPEFREPQATEKNQQHVAQGPGTVAPHKPAMPAPKVPVPDQTPIAAAGPSPSPAKPAVPDPVQQSAVKLPEPDRKAGPAPARKQRVPAAAEPALKVNELPPFIRNDLPEFRVSGHAYNPQSQNRVVRVNDKILQEGQELRPGLRVEEIIPDGIVFTYEGYRFRIPVTHNR